MKRLLLIIVTACLGIVVLTAPVQAQQRIVEKTFSVGTDEPVTLDLKFGDSVTVKAWDKKEVSFRAVILVNNGKLNDVLLLDYKHGKAGLTISSDYDKQRIKDGRPEDCPGNRYAIYNGWKGNRNGNSYAVCSQIAYEIRVPRQADLNVKSISSDIELFGLRGPVYAKSISGFVDLSWPPQQGADVSMKTVTGEVYSGLNGLLKLTNKKKQAPLVGYRLKGSIGSGGPLVSLESVSGNIYLRKEKI